MLELLQGPLLISLLAAMVRIATPLLFSAMGELVTQRGHLEHRCRGHHADRCGGCLHGRGDTPPHQIFLVLPYVASLVLLAGLRSRTHQPVALGIPYNRE
ncbi:hypothetical protein NKJ06_23560 [Mesorhizobium sp. M0293]|uniref:hypothetical protein n=1 Tax=unclassified Mesorhizobium TaxID=325217 RepID=UPI003339404B